jgi:hypothetical protein
MVLPLAISQSANAASSSDDRARIRATGGNGGNATGGAGGSGGNADGGFAIAGNGGNACDSDDACEIEQ